MSSVDNGGPAFPVADPFLAHSPRHVDNARQRVEGMSLRDYFAAKALQGWLASFPSDTETTQVAKGAHVVAVFAYAMADAMLKAREGGAS